MIAKAPVWKFGFGDAAERGGIVVEAGAGTRGQALDSLCESHLRERFYAWRGASGKRFVCSVFSVDDEALVADFSQCFVIGVARDGAIRRSVCVFAARDFVSEQGVVLRQDARAHGVVEWHVHFAAEEADLCDLASALLN